MIKATLSDGTVILGLSAKNVEKLKLGKPILFDGRPLNFPGNVIIVYGETEEAISSSLMRATGVEGSTQ